MLFAHLDAETSLSSGACMRSLTIGWGRAIALAASAMALLCSAAQAGELLVIPYSCRVIDGQPVLTPSDDHGYRVIGPREERDFTACSPSNPDMCRRWKVFRFDVECGGQRVPWASVSAAADVQRGGRSWIEGGSLHLDMPPRWSMDPDDPCARRFRVGWRSGPMSRYCEERRATARAEVVMPVGFAPMLDLDGIFVADGAPGAAFGEAASVARAELPAADPWRADTSATKPAPDKSTKAPEAPKPKPAATVAKSEPTTAPAAVAPPKPEPAPAPAASVSTATPSSATPVADAGTPAMPTIINQQGAAPPKAEPEKQTPAPVAAPEATASLAAAKDAPVVVAMKDAADEPRREGAPEKATAPPANDTHGREGPAVEVTILTTLTKSVSPTLLGIGGASMLALLALALAYRRNQSEDGFTFARDIDSVDFGGRKGSREVARAGRWLSPQPRGERAPATVSPYQQAPARWGDAIPQSREEALQVLGMGVAPEVSDAAIKKIVDGLRLSWHPDHAKDAPDRELREIRMKQINAAWEIIAGKRPG